MDYVAEHDMALTGSRAGTATLWHVKNVDELLEWVQANRYIRQLSCLERETYGLELCVEDK
jgi:hypothetical protein